MPTCTNCNYTTTSQKNYERHIKLKAHIAKTELVDRLIKRIPTVEKYEKIERDAAENLLIMETYWKNEILKLKLKYDLAKVAEESSPSGEA
jgi:uncharacterized C2H2 Zn-finger protein